MVLANRAKLQNSRSLVRVFGGLNETYACSEAEYSAGVNFSARDFPALSTRKPRRKLMTAAGGVFGFGAGLGLVLLLHFADRTLRSIQAGENLLHLPGLAALPADPATSLKAGLLHERPDATAQMEAFRSLRTALSILGKGTAARSYLFTSIPTGKNNGIGGNIAVTDLYTKRNTF